MLTFRFMFRRWRHSFARRTLGAALLCVAIARADTTAVAGSGTAFGNTQPTLAVQWYIATQGTFPLRDNLGGSAEAILIGEVRAFSQSNTISLTDRGWVPCDGRLLNVTQNAALFSLLGTTYGGNGVSTFAVPDLRGRVIVGAGEGPGLTVRTLGQTGGSETATLLNSNLPAHTHTVGGGNTSSVGGAQPFDNLQPWIALNAFIMSAGVYGSDIGWVRFTAANFVPAGYPCDGRLLAIAEDEAFFFAIGTTFGGDGVSTFAVPDLRGRIIVGAGQGSGLTSRNSGDKAGTETITLTASTMPLHTHAITGGTTGAAGSSSAHNTMQPYVVLPWVVSGQGLFGYPADSEPAVGELRLWAPAELPRGFIAANGGTLTISTNQPFYALVGTTYGGNGTSHFAVPDLRGRAAAYLSTSHALGSTWGAETVTLTSSNLPAHAHTYTISDTTPPTIVSIVRHSPTAQTTTDGTMSFTFRVTYSEAVTGVGESSFAVEPRSGSNVAGTVTAVAGSGATRDVTVTVSSGHGEFRLKATD